MLHVRYLDVFLFMMCIACYLNLQYMQNLNKPNKISSG